MGASFVNTERSPPSTASIFFKADLIPSSSKNSLLLTNTELNTKKFGRNPSFTIKGSNVSLMTGATSSSTLRFCAFASEAACVTFAKLLGVSSILTASSRICRAFCTVGRAIKLLTASCTALRLLNPLSSTTSSFSFARCRAAA